VASTPQLLEGLSRTFGDGHEREVASKLLEFLAAHSETSHLTLQFVRQLTPGANSGKHDRAIVRTLQYLAGDAIRMLDTKFELIDEYDAVHDLTNEEVNECLKDKVNPITGEFDENIGQKIVIYFCPTLEVRRLLQNEEGGR
jgi:hypothetical protein